MPIIANFLSGSNGGITLPPVTNIQTMTASEKVYIKWTDPDNIIVNDVSISEWEGTLLVRKAGSAPMSRRDGIIVMDSTVHNAYTNTYFCDSGLSNGVTYYYQLFPYSTSHTYTDSDECKFSAVPNAIAPNDVSNIEATFGSNKIYLKWTDPSDTVINGITVSQWAGTKVVYKTGGYPANPNDGTLVVNSTTFNQYKNTRLTISGLSNGVTYYIALFPYSTCNAVNINAVNRVISIPNYTAVSVPTVSDALTYSGSVQSPVWTNYDSSKMSIGGVTSATNAGRYEATFTPYEDYCWSDGTTATKTVAWEIKRKNISAVPSQSGTVTYNGSQQSPSWKDYISTELEISGVTVGTNAGTYTAVFYPTANYQWSDGSIFGKNIDWTISKATGSFTLSPSNITLRNSNPSATVTVSRLGDGTVTAVSNDTSLATVSVNGATITINNVNKKHGVATVTVSVGESSNYTAATNNVITVTCTFPKITTVPSQSNTLTYTGSAQSPSWSNYDANILAIGGTTSETNAGSYTATFTPKGDYSWSDGSVTAKSVTWTIGKAAGSLSISPTTLALSSSATSGTIKITRVGDGAISAKSSNTNVATVSVSGTTVTVKSVNNTSGTATVTVSVAAGTNHTAPTSKTVAVTAEFFPPVGTALNDMTWEQIRKVSDDGLAANYFSVGDRKAVTLNGTISDYLSFSNETYYCYIIGIDHNSGKEGANRIHFQFGYSALSGGTHIAFVDSKCESYMTVYNLPCFKMNDMNENAGGWNSCQMRTIICPAFKSSMPSDLQAVLKTTTKYSDNTGGGSNSSSYITATTDDIFLLAEFEVYGTRKYANSAEKNYQVQYAYYSAGNSKLRYKHNSTGTTVYWWLRSVYSGGDSSFCISYASGNVGEIICSYCSGFAPGFCV